MWLTILYASFRNSSAVSVLGFFGRDEPCFESRPMRVGVRSVIVDSRIEDVFCYTVDQRHCVVGLSRFPHLLMPEVGVNRCIETPLRRVSGACLLKMHLIHSKVKLCFFRTDIHLSSHTS